MDETKKSSKKDKTPKIWKDLNIYYCGGKEDGKKKSESRNTTKNQ